MEDHLNLYFQMICTIVPEEQLILVNLPSTLIMWVTIDDRGHEAEVEVAAPAPAQDHNQEAEGVAVPVPVPVPDQGREDRGVDVTIESKDVYSKEIFNVGGHLHDFSVVILDNVLQVSLGLVRHEIDGHTLSTKAT